MKAIPLETAVGDLAPATAVFVRLRGLVYTYPAAILADRANDFYVAAPGERSWGASELAWAAGRLLARRLGPARVNLDHDTLFVLTREIWRSKGACDSTFRDWWASVDPNADPEWIGAAACVGAHSVVTWAAFEAHHLLDVPDLGE